MRSSRRSEQRLKVLWPPLGPVVGEALDWGSARAKEQPFVAVALGLVVWPMAMATAVCGAPVVAADHLVQSTYDKFGETPLVVAAERTAAQVWQTGRLGVVCSKVAIRQAVRVGQRQLERHGGPEKIVEKVVHISVDRLSHPVDTIGQVWGGLVWGFGAIKDAVEQVAGNMEDKSTRMQELHQ